MPYAGDNYSNQTFKRVDYQDKTKTNIRSVKSTYMPLLLGTVVRVDIGYGRLLTDK